MQAGAIPAQHDDGQAGAIDHGHRNAVAHFLAFFHRGAGDRLRHRQGDILLGDQALRLRRGPQDGGEGHRPQELECR
jgi:hypothetical protein